MTVRQMNAKMFHQSPIICFTLHPEHPLVISGDESGKVFASNFITGEVSGCIGSHKDSVETIVINPVLNIAVSAGIDSKLNIYDLKDPTFHIRYAIEPTVYGGYSKLAISTIF